MAAESGATGAIAKAFEPLLDNVFQPDNGWILWPFAGAVFLAFVVRGGAAYAHSVIVNAVGQRVVATIQRQVYGHLIRSDLAYLQGQASGQLISRLVNDVNQMRMAVAECLTGIVRHGLTLVVLVGVMFMQDWLLATIAFTVFPVAGWFLGRLGRRLRKVATRTQEELGTFSAILGQTFQGARHVKAYGMEAHEEERVGGTIDRLRRLTVKSFRISASLMPLNETFSGIAVVAVIVYGGHQIAAGERTPGELVSFIGAFMLAYQPMNALSKLNAQLQIGLAAAVRVLEVLDTKPHIVDPPAPVALPAGRHGVRFEGVRFSYGGDKGALDGIDLEVPAGQTVALVGASGAGKSTVLNLIPRFYDVTGGRVLVGGHDVRDLGLASLRGNIALVSQETALFDDTIRANIAYGREGAGEAEIIRAARDAAAHDFITALPDGYDTRVGENGLRLSGGQRQRIAIARAMLRDAPILLLDEATSALDSESERLIQEALRRLQKGRTTLVIAHRLSTIVDADRIYVLDQGRVLEWGSHADLIRKGGAYARFHALQSGAEALAGTSG
ncbi:ABC transporter ATP-binding protein [Aerophototrophica crusticola]|uniref:ABC transporter ATP-binding protein n=2 Tax=Aerophototrophica crusticola TaxID=1709002 RepID=A0A858RBN3_9PROT|nr:ABC transporter ATP-binding protein [Rhodospirillaceae bacterium B3]